MIISAMELKLGEIPIKFIIKENNSEPLSLRLRVKTVLMNEMTQCLSLCCSMSCEMIQVLGIWHLLHDAFGGEKVWMNADLTSSKINNHNVIKAVLKV